MKALTWTGHATSRLSPDPHLNKTPHLPLTLYDVLGWDGLLFRFVANLIGFRRYKVNEFSAAVHHQLPGIVGHPDVGESLFDHLIDSSSGYSEIIVVARWGSHRIALSRAPRLLKTPQLWSTIPRRFFKRLPSEVWSQEREEERVQKMKGVGGGEEPVRERGEHPCERFRARLGRRSGGWGLRGQHCPGRRGESKGGPEIWALGNHLRVPWEERALSPNRSPTAPEQRQGPGALASPPYRADTQRAWL